MIEDRTAATGFLLEDKIPNSVKVTKDRKNLRQLEHDYAIRLWALKQKESVMEKQEAECRSRYAYYGGLFAAMREKENDLKTRESAFVEREKTANNLDKTLQDRMHNIEINEEFQALKASERNEVLKTRIYGLDEREELVVLGRSVIRARESHVTRREYLLETRENKFEGVEQTLIVREAAVKAIETELDLTEAAAKASEDALGQREESAKATVKHDQDNLKLYEANLRYSEERLQKKDEKINWEFTNREFLVIEREQKIEAMERASKMGWVIPMATSKDDSGDLYKWMGGNHEVEN